LRQTLQHDQRVTRPAAQALRAGEHVHDRRVILRSRLHGAPREIVKAFVVLSLCSLECELTALVPLLAIAAWLSILKRESDDDEGEVDQGHAGLSQSILLPVLGFRFRTLATPQ
jgi:hypothetical protein